MITFSGFFSASLYLSPSRFEVCFFGVLLVIYEFTTCLTMASAIILFACSYKSYDCVRIAYAIFHTQTLKHSHWLGRTLLFTNTQRHWDSDWVLEGNNHFFFFACSCSFCLDLNCSFANIKGKSFPLWSSCLFFGVSKSSKSVLFAINLLRHVNRVKWSIPGEKFVWMLEGLFPSTNGFSYGSKWFEFLGYHAWRKISSVAGIERRSTHNQISQRRGKKNF